MHALINFIFTDPRRLYRYLTDEGVEEVERSLAQDLFTDKPFKKFFRGLIWEKGVGPGVGSEFCVLHDGTLIDSRGSVGSSPRALRDLLVPRVKEGATPTLEPSCIRRLDQLYKKAVKGVKDGKWIAGRVPKGFLILTPLQTHYRGIIRMSDAFRNHNLVKEFKKEDLELPYYT